MKKVFYFLLLTSVVLILSDYFALNKYLCETYSCSSKIEGTLLDWFIIITINLLIVIILKFINVNCFASWWKFSRVATPVILIATFIVNLGLHHNPGGWFNIDDAKDMFLYFVIYGLFIIGSLIQIYRGYKK